MRFMYILVCVVRGKQKNPSRVLFQKVSTGGRAPGTMSAPHTRKARPTAIPFAGRIPEMTCQLLLYYLTFPSVDTYLTACT